MEAKRKVSGEFAPGLIAKKIKILDSRSGSGDIFNKEDEVATGSEESETPCDTAIEDPCISDECAQSHVEMEKASQDIFFLQADTLHLRTLLEKKDQEICDLKAGQEGEVARLRAQAEDHQKKASKFRVKSCRFQNNLNTCDQVKRLNEIVEEQREKISQTQQGTKQLSEALNQERDSKKNYEAIVKAAKEFVGVDCLAWELGDKLKKLEEVAKRL